MWLCLLRYVGRCRVSHVLRLIAIFVSASRKAIAIAPKRLEEFDWIVTAAAGSSSRVPKVRDMEIKDLRTRRVGFVGVFDWCLAGAALKYQHCAIHITVL